MKSLLINPLHVSGTTAKTLSAAMDREGIPFHTIDTVNWKEYPYLPRAQFRIGYTPDAFALHYRVGEGAVRALAAADNGPVWEDSCMEFFFAPYGDNFYYNIECNCAGTLLLGMGSGRHDRTHVPRETLARIDRHAALGRATFGTREGEQTWEVSLLVPYDVFTHRPFRPEKGMTIRGNFYKCGDKLPHPHFLSWNPVIAPQPDFHRPECFGQLVLL